MGKMIEIPAVDVFRLLDTKTIAAALLERVSMSSPTGIPAIGHIWPGQGGVYAGMVRGRNAPDYHLIVHGDEISDANFTKATDWAVGLEGDDHKDFTLPFRYEQSVLFGNVPELFKPNAYWSCERHAEYSDCAWYQYFGNGGQISDHRDYELFARAVRRLTIQPFCN